MGLITFYPLLFQTYMSFTDFGLRNLRPGSEAPPFVGLDNYINDRHRASWPSRTSTSSG